MKTKVLSFVLAISFIFCVFVFSGCGSTPPNDDLTHTHNWATAWSKNSTEHWLACAGCDEKRDMAKHDTTPCTICGYGELSDNNNDSNDLPTVTSIRDLEIITIQAGQGVAILVKLPDGKDMLIDSGDLLSMGEVDRMIYMHVEDLVIEYFVLTSSDQYVCGIAPYIFTDFDVLNFYRPSVKSDYKTALGLPEEYNSGESPYVENDANYAAALEYSSCETGCQVYVIDDTSCDITYEFKDAQNNKYSYTIDFITPIAPGDRSNKYDNDVMVSIEYADTTTLITAGASSNIIDTYCNTYGTQKDVDVLITFWRNIDNVKYAISRSDLRGTNFLEKISLTKGDYSIFVPIAATSGYDELLNELHATVNGLFNLNEKHTVTTKVTSDGVLTVAGE